MGTGQPHTQGNPPPVYYQHPYYNPPPSQLYPSTVTYNTAGYNPPLYSPNQPCTYYTNYPQAPPQHTQYQNQYANPNPNQYYQQQGLPSYAHSSAVPQQPISKPVSSATPQNNVQQPEITISPTDPQPVKKCKEDLLKIQVEANRLIAEWFSGKNRGVDMTQLNRKTEELLTQQQLKLDIVEIPSDPAYRTQLREMRKAIIMYTEKFIQSIKSRL